MRTGGSLGCVGTGQLVQKPVRGRAEALLVLLWSTTHFDCCVRLVVEVVGGPVEAVFEGVLWARNISISLASCADSKRRLGTLASGRIPDYVDDPHRPYTSIFRSCHTPFVPFTGCNSTHSIHAGPFEAQSVNL